LDFDNASANYNVAQPQKVSSERHDDRYRITAIYVKKIAQPVAKLLAGQIWYGYRSAENLSCRDARAFRCLRF